VLNLDLAGTDFRAVDGKVVVTPAASTARNAACRWSGLDLCGSEEFLVDDVIVAAGWRFDTTALGTSLRLPLGPNGKHPATTALWESGEHPGVYFAGAAAHGLDHRRSSGGFIHGFRYSARALHRVLEHRAWAGGESVQGAPPRPWPHTAMWNVSQVERTALQRLHTSAGLFQLFGFMADVLVLGRCSWGGEASAAAPPTWTQAEMGSLALRGLWFHELPGVEGMWSLLPDMHDICAARTLWRAAWRRHPWWYASLSPLVTVKA